MSTLTRNSSIEILALSRAIRVSLVNHGLSTLGELLDLDGDFSQFTDLSSTRKKKLRAYLESIQLDVSDEPAPDLSDASVDTLESLGLSIRSLNCLHNAGIHTIEELRTMPRRALMQVKNLGSKSADEIIGRLEVYTSQHQKEKAPGSVIREQLYRVRAVVDVLTDPTFGAVNGQPFAPLSVLDSMWNDALYAEPRKPITEEQMMWLKDQTTLMSKFGNLGRYERGIPEGQTVDENGEPLANLELQDNLVHMVIRLSILRKLDTCPDGITREDLLVWLAPGMRAEILDLYLTELLQENRITCWDVLVEPRFPTVMEHVMTIPDERKRTILLERLNGISLDKVGKHFSLTGQGVSDLSNRLIARFPRVREDRYRDVFLKYDFSRDDFATAFDESDCTYQFLELVRNRTVPRKPLEEALTDDSIPVLFRRRIEKAVYRNYVTIDGSRVPRRRPAMVRFMVRKFCTELTSMENFCIEYTNALEELGLADDKSLAIEPRTYETRLNACDYVLWSQFRRFRYYPIAEREYTSLLETLDLENMDDTELSSLKFFRDYPDLMQEYDIRDEYELHNLLKKIWPKGVATRVHFKKMPTIEIGKPDRDRQVLDLLGQYTPISRADLAVRYEERYGTKAATTTSNYFSCLRPYLDNGVYRLDLTPLAEDRLDHMRRLLTEDFYRTPDILALYEQEYPGSSADDINALVLRQLGFHVCTNYVISDKYSSAADYFRHLLTTSSYTSLKGDLKPLSGISTFSCELLLQKSRRNIIETGPGEFVSITQLNREGVTLDDIQDYCNAVADFKAEGSFFTITSLRREGFTHPLQEKGYSNWFYSALLQWDDRFRTHRIARNRLIRRGTEDFQVSDFFKDILRTEVFLELDDFRTQLEEKYEFYMPGQAILEFAQDTDMYYDSVMNELYYDSDAFQRVLGEGLTLAGDDVVPGDDEDEEEEEDLFSDEDDEDDLEEDEEEEEEEEDEDDDEDDEDDEEDDEDDEDDDEDDEDDDDDD